VTDNESNEGEDWQRVSRALESAIRLNLDGDHDAAMLVFDSSDERVQRLMFAGLIAMVAHLRSERGDAPDATYGPDETVGL
jgi:hypothetical protein